MTESSWEGYFAELNADVEFVVIKRWSLQNPISGFFSFNQDFLVPISCFSIFSVVDVHNLRNYFSANT